MATYTVDVRNSDDTETIEGVTVFLLKSDNAYVSSITGNDGKAAFELSDENEVYVALFKPGFMSPVAHIPSPVCYGVKIRMHQSPQTPVTSA